VPGGSVPEIDDGPGSLDPDCITEAAGDPAAIQKCLK